jgi:hypothetical protein
MMTMNWAAAITASPSQPRSAAGGVDVDISFSFDRVPDLPEPRGDV